MATLTRSTPNFALPATQNTAPVHEFRCLYTHDIRKKAKKWHDGSARFHTFNRRVMVYDDAKSYIGDQHYRADEEFGEGIELQLDRGVLVEVGERMGVTQTDLTGIVHRSNVDIASAPNASANVRPRSTQRANNLSTQGRPKSLTELLGTTQNRVGRAVLPVTSPFEQRQALADAQHAERPAKRQKLLFGKENHHTGWQTPDKTHLDREPLSSSVTASSPITSRTHNQQDAVTQPSDVPVRNVAGIIDISSDEDVPRQSTKPTRGVAKGSKPKDLQGQEEETSSRKAGERNDTDEARNAQGRHTSSVQGSEQRSVSLLKSASILIGSNGGSNSLSKPTMSSLKMRSQEPRRKLMYKALMPPNIRGAEPETTNVTAEQHDQIIDNEEIPIRGLSRVLEAIVEDQDFEMDGFNELPESASILDAAPPLVPQLPQLTPQKQLTVLSPSDPSPMFFSQRASQRSPTPTQDFIEDDFDIPATQAALKDNGNSTNEVIDNAIRISDDEDTSEPDSPYFPLPPPRSKPMHSPVLSTMLPPQPTISLPPRPALVPAAQRTPSPKKTRAFARSLSESDSPLPNDPRASPYPSLLAVVEDSPIVNRKRPSPLRPPPRNPSLNKSAFQRCRSDTAAIIPTTVLESEEPSDPTEEQGPWSKLEAFLLFDKWPMCKQRDKPVFEPPPDVDQDLDPSDLDSDGDRRVVNGFVRPVIGGRKVQPVLIRSARAVLRDG